MRTLETRYALALYELTRDEDRGVSTIQEATL